MYLFLKNVGNQKVAVDTDIHIIFSKSMATINCSVTNILQNIFFCAQQKEETHTGLEQLGRE